MSSFARVLAHRSASFVRRIAKNKLYAARRARFAATLDMLAVDVEGVDDVVIRRWRARLKELEEGVEDAVDRAWRERMDS